MVFLHFGHDDVYLLRLAPRLLKNPSLSLRTSSPFCFVVRPGNISTLMMGIFCLPLASTIRLLAIWRPPKRGPSECIAWESRWNGKYYMLDAGRHRPQQANYFAD